MQFPEHGFYGLQDKILLFRHNQSDANILKIISAATEVQEGTLIEVVLSGEYSFSHSFTRSFLLSSIQSVTTFVLNTEQQNRILLTTPFMDHSVQVLMSSKKKSKKNFRVAFRLAQYSTAPPRANVDTCPIPVHPWVVQHMLNNILCNGGCTQMGILSVYTPYVYWNMVAYQNVTPALKTRMYECIHVIACCVQIFLKYCRIHCKNNYSYIYLLGQVNY